MRISLARLLFAAAVIFSAQVVASNAWSQMGSEQLVGTWNLVSWKIDQTDGPQKDSPYGPNASGWIMYQPDGKMCVMITRADRPKFAANSALSGTPEEIKAAYETGERKLE